MLRRLSTARIRMMRKSRNTSCLLPHNQHDSEANFISHQCVRKLRRHLQAERFRSSGGYVAGAGGVSSASIEDPVIVPAIELLPERSATGFASIGSVPPPPATMKLATRSR